MTSKTLIAFLKVLYNVSQIKKERITFEQYSRIHLVGPKIAVCETASNVVFVLNSAFTTMDHYFQAPFKKQQWLSIACYKTLGIRKNLKFMILRPTKPILHNNSRYSKQNYSTHLVSLFDYISRFFLHLF